MSKPKPRETVGEIQRSQILTTAAPLQWPADPLARESRVPVRQLAKVESASTGMASESRLFREIIAEMEAKTARKNIGRSSQPDHIAAATARELGAIQSLQKELLSESRETNALLRQVAEKLGLEATVATRAPDHSRLSPLLAKQLASARAIMRPPSTTDTVDASLARRMKPEGGSRTVGGPINEPDNDKSGSDP